MNIHEYANELIQSYYLKNKGHSLTFHLILFLRKYIKYKYRYHSLLFAISLLNCSTGCHGKANDLVLPLVTDLMSLRLMC